MMRVGLNTSRGPISSISAAAPLAAALHAAARASVCLGLEAWLSALLPATALSSAEEAADLAELAENEVEALEAILS